MFKKQSIPMSCLTISDRVEANKIRFDLEIQRRGCWSLKKKQELIDSLLFGYSVPPLYFVDKGDDFYWTLDGQQRCRAVGEFITDGFALLPDTIPYLHDNGTEYAVAGLKYSELPQKVQSKLNATNIGTYTFSNITEDEIREQFRRLNNGEPMKKIEITRVDAGTETMRFINDISNMEFFKSKVNISDKARIHFTDHEVILQSMALITEADMGLSGKELQQLAITFKVDGISEEIKSSMIETTKYLDKVFPDMCKYLKKANIPVMFYVANYARKNDVDAVDFFDWVNTFYTELSPDSRYAETYSDGSAKRDNVQRRLSILLEDFKNSVGKEPEAIETPVISIKAASSIKKPLHENLSFYDEEVIENRGFLPSNVMNAIQGSY